MTKGFSFTFWACSIFASLWTGFMVRFDTARPHEYSLLFLLPLTFCLLTILSGNCFTRIIKTTPALILYALYMMRNVVVVYVMYKGNYAGYYSTSNGSDAIILMAYETVIIFFTMWYAIHRYSVQDVECEVDLDLQEWTNRKVPPLFALAFYIIILFMVVVFITHPSVKGLYISLYRFNGSLMTESVTTVAGDGNRSIITLFTFFADFMRVLLPVYLFRVIRRYVGTEWIGVLLSLPIIALQMAFVGATSALAIFCAFVDFYALLRIYPNYQKQLTRLLYVSAGLIVVVLFVVKFSNTVLYTGSEFEGISEMMQAYFGGVCNISASFNIPKTEKWSALFFDLYYTIPFNGTLFGLSGKTSANLFNAYNYGKFQIIPCIGQSYYYLGAVLAPIVPAMMCYFAIKVFNTSKQESNIWMYTSKTLLWFYLCISPIMYNGQILLGRLNNTILPCLLVTFLAQKYYRRGKS